jgi:hypothetical protein
VCNRPIIRLGADRTHAKNVNGPVIASALTLAICAVVLAGCGGGGSSSACGDATPQDNGSQAYLSVDGDPVVKGDVSCTELLDLVATIKNNKGGPRLTAALKRRGGWLVVPDAYKTVGQPDDFVVGRSGGEQVAFSPTLGL